MSAVISSHQGHLGHTGLRQGPVAPLPWHWLLTLVCATQALGGRQEHCPCQSSRRGRSGAALLQAPFISKT